MGLHDRINWDEKYSAGDHTSIEPSSLLTDLDTLLPKTGRALDLAGGSGRHAIWLAKRGLQVTLVDVSPIAIKLSSANAAAADVAITAEEGDLEAGFRPSGRWDVIVSFHYLQRSLFAWYPSVLTDGGILVFVQPTKSNLSRHKRPSERFLLDDGELPQLVDGLEIIRYNEAWRDDGQHLALLVARKPLSNAEASP